MSQFTTEVSPAIESSTQEIVSESMLDTQASLSPKLATVPAQPPSVQRSVTKLQKIGNTVTRQKMFSAIGKKYGNNYQNRVAANYHTTPAASPAEIGRQPEEEQNSLTPLAHEINPVVQTATSNLENITNIQAQAEPQVNRTAVAQPPTEAAPLPASETSAEIDMEAMSISGDGEDDQNDKKRPNTVMRQQNDSSGQQRQKGRRIQRMVEPTIQRAGAGVADLALPEPLDLTERVPVAQTSAFATVKAATTAISDNQKSFKGQIASKEANATSATTDAKAAAPLPANESDGHSSSGGLVALNDAKPGELPKETLKTNLATKITGMEKPKIEDITNGHFFSVEGPLETAKTNIKTDINTERTNTVKPLETAKTTVGTSLLPTFTPKTMPVEDTTAPAQTDLGVSSLPPLRTQTEIDAMPTQNKDYLKKTEDAVEIGDFKLTDKWLLASQNPVLMQTALAKKELEISTTASQFLLGISKTASQTNLTTDTTTSINAGVADMHTARTNSIGSVTTNQDTASTAASKTRETCIKDIKNIYDTTKVDVNKILSDMETQANTDFNTAETAARNTFYTGLGNKAWAIQADFDEANSSLFGLDGRHMEQRFSGDGYFWTRIENGFDYKNVHYAPYQDYLTAYTDALKASVDTIATTVTTKLNAAKTRIQTGKTDVENYIKNLDPNIQKSIQAEIAQIQTDFDSLTTQVDSRAQSLTDELANKYDAAGKALDTQIRSLFTLNQGLLANVAKAVTDAIQTVNTLRDLLLTVINKALKVIGDILKDPSAFFKNIGKAFQDGFNDFVEGLAPEGNPLNGTLAQNISKWLLGVVTQAGLTLPSSLDDWLGWAKLGMQVLGINQQYVQGKIDEFFQKSELTGLQKKIKRALKRAKQVLDWVKTNEGTILEGIQLGIDLYTALRQGGVAQFITVARDKLAQIVEKVAVEAITTLKNKLVEFVKQKVLAAVTEMLAPLLAGPVGAIIETCKQIAETISGLIKDATEILSAINTGLDAIEDIVLGNTKAASAKIKATLDLGLDLLMKFVFRKLGLDNLPGEIKTALEAVHTKFDEIISSIIDKIAEPFKNEAFKKFITQAMGNTNPDVQAIQKKLADLSVEHQADLSSIPGKKFGKVISKKGAEAVVSAAMATEEVGSTVDALDVVEAGSNWQFHYFIDEDTPLDGNIPAGSKSETVTDDLRATSLKLDETLAATRKKLADVKTQCETATNQDGVKAMQDQLVIIDKCISDLAAQKTTIDAQYALEKLDAGVITAIYTSFADIQKKSDEAMGATEAIMLDPALLALFDNDEALARIGLATFNNNKTELISLMTSYKAISKDATEAWTNLFDDLSTMERGYQELNDLIVNPFGGKVAPLASLKTNLTANAEGINKALAIGGLYYNAPQVTNFVDFALPAVPVLKDTGYIGSTAVQAAKLYTQIFIPLDFTAKDIPTVTALMSSISNDYTGLFGLISKKILPKANFADYSTWAKEGPTKVILEGGKWGTSDATAAPDAYYSMLQYDLSNHSEGTALLGNYSTPGLNNNSTGVFMQYSDVWIGDKVGTTTSLAVLDVGGLLNWTINVNFSWIQGIIDRGGTFLVIADLTNDRNKPQDPSEPIAPSVTSRELGYIQKRGYSGSATRGTGKLYVTPDMTYYYNIKGKLTYTAKDNSTTNEIALNEMLELKQKLPGDLSPVVNGTTRSAVSFELANLETQLPAVWNSYGSQLQTKLKEAQDKENSLIGKEHRTITMSVGVDPWGTSAVEFVYYSKGAK